MYLPKGALLTSKLARDVVISLQGWAPETSHEEIPMLEADMLSAMAQAPCKDPPAPACMSVVFQAPPGPNAGG